MSKMRLRFNRKEIDSAIAETSTPDEFKIATSAQKPEM
jgi:hypothetical protein